MGHVNARRRLFFFDAGTPLLEDLLGDSPPRLRNGFSSLPLQPKESVLGNLTLPPVVDEVAPLFFVVPRTEVEAVSTFDKARFLLPPPNRFKIWPDHYFFFETRSHERKKELAREID